ncbi:HAMP domain-containing sensor histidine kinase [Haloarcula sediminis]|uniref:HAMP domain-containing sensor histidine kinase n=1 Tax=Haloarcula sediminis TaxID=3111777 RepID=UPI002D7A2CC8|nr:HAMP domain-containing sensor histidine kinase [Haloarcula sp. CK38]
MRFSPVTQLSTRFDSVASDIAERLPDTTAGGPALAAGLGIGHVLVAGWNLTREINEFGAEMGPLMAFGLIGGAGLTVCVLAVRLFYSEFDSKQRWLVGWSAVGGATLFGAIVYISILVRLAEGRVIAEPIFVLSLASGMGAVAGVVVGELYATALQSAAVADRQRDQLEFMQSLFRHDVMNSLTVIQSRAEFLTQDTDGQNNRFAETILEYAQNIVGLADRVERMSDVITGRGEIETSPTELRPIVERQVTPLRKSHEEITFDVDVDEVTVVADSLLEEVVGNLVKNAVEHGYDGSDDFTVSVWTTSTGGRTQLHIADTGTGISEELRGEIFERGTSESGSGFGLFFVETMVDHYGGSVRVEANEPSGSVFVVELVTA